MPRLVIHAAFEVHPDYIGDRKALFKEITRESLAGVGTVYYVCELPFFSGLPFVLAMQPYSLFDLPHTNCSYFPQ
jgi:hypothetical protein